MNLLVKALLSFTLAFSVGVQAENKALIIGIGTYQNPDDNLPGIDIDIANMHQVVRMLGYKENNIKILRDEQATKGNIINSIKNHLIYNSDSADSTFLYFSGHGSHIRDENGDEDDGVDEVLLAYDTHMENDGKFNVLKNLVIDDELFDLLSQIESKNIYVYIDSCHSGTVTRGIPLKPNALGEKVFYSKLHTYEGMPKNSNDSWFAEKNSYIENKTQNWITFSAAQDGESSIATGKGSVFTLGVAHHIMKALDNNLPLTYNELARNVTEYVKAKLVGTGKIHTPKLTGSRELKRKTIAIVPSSQTSTVPVSDSSTQSQVETGLVWQKLTSLVEASTPMPFTSPRATVSLGSKIQFNLNSPMSGYLNVVSVNANDSATVLFPNKYNQDNYVNKGSLSIPTMQMPFNITAQKPLGATLTVAFITNEPIDLYESATEGRDATGELVDTLVPLSEAGMRGFVVSDKTLVSYAGQVTVIIK